MDKIGGEKKAPLFLHKTALQLRDGIIDNNPMLVQILGTCPTLAVTTSVKNAVGMGIATTSVLIFSNLAISLLRRFIPRQVRLASYIVIISGFVSAVQMIIKAFFPSLDRALGVFIPLIVVNCILLARAEVFASKNPPLASAVDGLSMGLGFSLVLLAMGFFREIVGCGTVAGFPAFPAFYKPALIFVSPPGAFLTLAFIIAAVQFIRNLSEKRKLAAGSAVNDGIQISRIGKAKVKTIAASGECKDNSKEIKKAATVEEKNDKPAGSEPEKQPLPGDEKTNAGENKNPENKENKAVKKESRGPFADRIAAFKLELPSQSDKKAGGGKNAPSKESGASAPADENEIEQVKQGEDKK